MRQLQLINQRLQLAGIGLQAQILCLRQRRIAGLGADAAFNVVELAASIGLLLRQLVEGVGNIAGAFLLLLSLATFLQ